MLRNLWAKFWCPSGRGLVLFFGKFLLFSCLCFFMWNAVKHPYNSFLQKTTINLIKDDIPIIAFKFYQNSDPEKNHELWEKGTLEIVFKPLLDGPAITKDPAPVPIKLLLNISHMNFVPFFALILATPVKSWRKFFLFAAIGGVLLAISQIFYIQLNLHTFYYKIQTFVIDGKTMSPERYHAAEWWLYKIKFLRSIQSFMQQAGTMIIPFFLWLIYAQSWILSTLVNISKPQKHA